MGVTDGPFTCCSELSTHTFDYLDFLLKHVVLRMKPELVKLDGKALRISSPDSHLSVALVAGEFGHCPLGPGTPIPLFDSLPSNFDLSLSHFTQKWWMQVEGFTLSPWPGFTILKHSLIKF